MFNIVDSKILEGARIIVSIFKLTVIVPQVLEDDANPEEGVLKLQVKFKATSNVKAIQGVVFSKLPIAIRKKTKCEDLMVTYEGKSLERSTNLSSLDWKDGESIIVTYKLDT